MYPFPYEALKEELLEYPQAEIYWVQEEPSNMGAFLFVKHRVESVNQSITGKYEELLFIGRKASASPATGIANRHAENQLNILRLATESERSEIKDNYRLACQVKVKGDLEVKIPDEIFSIQKWECTVKSNENVATFIKELVLELPKGENLDFESGGYIQIDIPKYELKYSEFDVEEEYREDWDKFKMWDLVAKNDNPDEFRAYSMANHPAEGNIVMLNVRIAHPPPQKWDAPPGIASSFIFNLKPGDKVNISGPYGDFFIKDTDREMVYICLLYTSPSPRDRTRYRMPSSA